MAGIRSRSPATAARKTRLRASWSRLTWQSGIATIAIDRPGYGFGPLSTYAVLFTDSSSMTFFLVGGRSIRTVTDRRGEGFGAAPPRANLDTSGRDGHRQWVADHMQLVREIEVGMDVDGDDEVVGPPDPALGSGRASGGHFPGGAERSRGCSFRPTARWSIDARGGFPPVLQSRVPSVINSPGITSVNESRSHAILQRESASQDGAPFTVSLEKNGSQVVRSPVINTVAGAADPPSAGRYRVGIPVG